jgi:chromosome segregation ATPase
LYLNKNLCIDTQGYSKSHVLDVIALTKEKCYSSYYNACLVKNRDLELAVEALKNEVTKTADEKKVLEANVANLNARVETLLKENLDLKAQLDASEKRNKNQQGKIKLLEEEKKVLTESIASLNLNFESLQSENVKLRSEIEFYVETVANLQRIIKTLEESTKSSDEKISELSCLVEKWDVFGACPSF